jgi:hypothetical protein
MFKLKTPPLLLLFMLLAPFFAAAQVTTSSMTGTVKSEAGEPLAGATISATHVPTGRVYRVATTKDGQFDIQNMNPGGPYTIVVSFVGFNDNTVSESYLNLGETSTQNIRLKDKTTVLENVVVAGRKGVGKTGSETNIGRDKVANLPSVGRNLTDLVRFVPQVKITDRGGMSIAGQNNRYNSFMIDGAVNNDLFGLSDQGTNGGRAGAPPISLDAIDQITVQISPYDVSLGNFTGGGINAITRSGTNEITGSLYYIYRNQDLSGKSPIPVLKPGTTNQYERTKLTDFENKTFGFRIGGPIIQNKAFFFLNYERQDDSRPQPFDPSTYRGSYINNDSLNVLINHLKTTHSYDPGEFVNNPDQIKADRIATRFDWNINDNHQLMVSYRYTKLARTNPRRSTNQQLNFTNFAEYYPSNTHSVSGELNSKISDHMNNKFRVTFTDVVDDRSVTGNPFPAIAIRDGNSSTLINMGSEISSGANLLKQNILNFYDAFKLTKGKNTFTIGTDIDINKTYNLFINRNYGFYEYVNIGSFMKNQSPIRYRRGYSLVDNGKTGDESINSAASFKTARIGFFVGDDIKLNENFTLTVGVRADQTKFLDDPLTDPFFNDSAIVALSQHYDLKGARSGLMYKPKWMLAPRAGFKYNIPAENITIRGGIGLFSGRIPLVWPGGVYQNTGVTVGAIDQRNTPNLLGNGQQIEFKSDINKQYTATDFGLANPKPQGDMNLVARDFKLPKVLRSSLAFDKRLNDGWSFTLEGIFTKNINEVDWQNLLYNPATIKQTTGPEKRNVYDPVLGANGIKIPIRTQLTLAQRNPYTNIILVKNTEGEKGYSYNFSFTVDKAFRNGFAFNANYVYGSSMVRNEGTSSINTSNWTNMEAVNGRNYIGLTTSDFDLGHRITTYISKKFTYAKGKLGTTVTLDYVGQSGSPVSYTVGGNMSGDGANFYDLMYIPTEAELATMIFTPITGASPLTPAQQRTLFNTYIESDKYLKKNRGSFAERNASRLPFTNIVNLKIQQDFNLKIAKKVYQLQLTYDVFNFTNLLNKDWGRQYTYATDPSTNPDQVLVLQFIGYQTGTATPTYQYLAPTTPNGKPYIVNDQGVTYSSSRWSSQLGVRINF